MITWNSGASEDVVGEVELFLGSSMLVSGTLSTEKRIRTAGHRLGRG